MALNKSEAETRRDIIDKILLKNGWDVNDPSRVLQEVDTKNSDFGAKKYVYRNTTLSKDEKAYADYVLMNFKGEPVAVIEAKKTSKDPEDGQRQAEGYVEDIQKTFPKGVLIYYTNGFQFWFWNKGHNNPRLVNGFHSPEDLETIMFHNDYQKPFLDVPINEDITNRIYQVNAIKRIEEGLDDGRRKFLLALATGTGKTRIAMSVIDILLRAQRAKRILFLTDRTELNEQAYYENILKFFPNESTQLIHSKDVNEDSRIYASTLQTMINNYKYFSIGFFDVIIVDEAHRSIYGENKLGKILAYFDAITIGLTATPSDFINRDTYRMFGCERNAPTFFYSYEEAVPKYLSRYEVQPTQTNFQRHGITLDDLPPEQIERLRMEGYDLETFDFEGSDVEKTVINTGTTKVLIEEFMDKCIKDDNGDPAKTIFFAISIKHAKHLKRVFEDQHPEYKGELADVITYENPRKRELVKDFKKKSMPRIAISVGILDTGVDIPEVCNLVFMRPTSSKIRFWQMIGRGTRHNDICKNRTWLPEDKKDYFLIFDYFRNFEFFDLNPEGADVFTPTPMPITIFLNRLILYKKFTERNDSENTEKIRLKIISDIDELDEESLLVQSNMKYILETRKSNFWGGLGLDPIKYLQMHIAPLMKDKKNLKINQQRFIFYVEQLLTKKLDLESDTSLLDDITTKKFIDGICSYIRRIPDSSDPSIMKKIKNANEVYLNPDYWDNVTDSNLFTITEELEPLFELELTSEERTIIEIDIDDSIFERGPIIYGPDRSEMPVETYKMKVERRVIELANSHPTVQKIKNNEELDEDDIVKLEESLYSPELYISEEQLRKAYNTPNGEIVDFIKHILGLIKLRDPYEVIDEAFRVFVINNPHFSSDQIAFIRILQTVFERKKHIELQDLHQLPFTNLGSTIPEPMFKNEEIKNMVMMCKNIENEVFKKR